MNLAEEMAVIYSLAEKEELNKIDSKTEKVIKHQIASITRQLRNRANDGISQIRLVTKTIHPNVSYYFEDEGFIVWRNDLTTVIKIPLQHN